MTEEITKTFIEGQFSILVAVLGVFGSFAVSYFTASFVAKKERQYKFVEKLYEKRLESYTKLLKITQEIGKDASAVELHTEARKEMKKWQVETDGYLLLSNNALDEFNKLKELLKKNPGKGKEYTDEQRKNFFHARNSLRGSLRDDFDFFHNSEKKL